MAGRRDIVIQSPLMPNATMIEDRVPDYVVRITAKSPNSTTEVFVGSGVLIAPELVLTCRHVCWPEASSRSLVKLKVFSAGEPEPIGAELLHHDKGRDLAVLKLTCEAANVIPPSWDYPKLSDGDKVRIIGFPKDRAYNRERAVVNADDLEIVIKGNVIGGISGGVGQVTNEYWYPGWCCVGIIKETQKTPASWLIPEPEIREFLESHGLSLPGRNEQNPAKYIAYLRRECGFISLMSLGATGRGVGVPEDVEIDRLWVPARTSAVDSETKSRGEVTDRLADAVNRHRLVVVEADAGAGKSTFLKRLAFAMVREDKAEETLKLRYTGLPLWLPVKEFESYLAEQYVNHGVPGKASPAWLSRYFEWRGRKRWGLERGFFDDLLNRPENLLLVDGLDEAAPAWRKVLAELFQRAGEEFPCGLVLTLRPEAEHAGRLLAGVSARFPIREMDDTEIALFVQQWTRLVKSYDETDADEHAETLLRNLQRPAIRTMARNPLMLTLLAMLTRGRPGYRLPEQRAELYELIVERLAESRPDDEFSPPAFLENLGVLALWMTRRESRKYQAGFDDAAKKLAEYTQRVGRLKRCCL